MLKRITLHLLIVSVLAILTACGSSKTTRVSSGSYIPGKNSGAPGVSTAGMAPQSAALVDKALSWIGTPYRYGGNDRNGIDCSGLVLRVYKDALGIPLPRSSREQRDYCTSVSKDRLVPGDLIFFATGKNRKTVSHVGIFVGDNQMIHASASKGVIVSDITTPYYSRTYVGSGIVDSYHAMLGDSYRKPVPEIHISKLESPAGFSLTPVERLPQPKHSKQQKQSEQTATSVQSAPSVQSGDAVRPVRTVTASAQPAAQPSAEDARASVLGSLREKDL